MRTDAQRQSDYQQRRLVAEDRVTFWLNRDVERLMDELRGREPRAIWIRRAVTELIYRQLADVKFTEILNDKQIEKAIVRAKDFGVELPK